jgi:transcriptional repressor NrdR
MRCPFCNAEKDSLKVIDSRTCEGGRSIRRRRQCLACNKRFTTYERVEENMKLTVVKRDGRRVPWDRNKILEGLQRACFKRPVPEEALLKIVDEVEEEAFRTHDREVLSTYVGQLVVEKLRRLDHVAYVRFASVYRSFKTIEELVEEAKAVIDAKRFEDPTQGKLFLDPAAARSNPDDDEPQPRSTGNGSPARGRRAGKSKEESSEGRREEVPAEHHP